MISEFILTKFVESIYHPQLNHYQTTHKLTPSTPLPYLSYQDHNANNMNPEFQDRLLLTWLQLKLLKLNLSCVI